MEKEAFAAKQQCKRFTLRNNMNENQQKAVKQFYRMNRCDCTRPPGTGKTTTLIEAIVQLVKNLRKYWYQHPAIQPLIILPAVCCSRE